MKITVISSSETKEARDLQRAAKKLDISLQVMDITDINDLTIYTSIGDVVIWRSSSLGGEEQRQSFLKSLEARGIIVINSGLVKNQYVTNKLYQQKTASRHVSLHTIPTYNFQTLQSVKNAVREGKLLYPFIKKASLSSEGREVYLVQKEQDISFGSKTKPIRKYIFQNFIANTGDYRVFIVGGKPLGAIKRTPASGDFRANVSQGGGVFHETDVKILSELYQIAVNVSSLFDLQICGVDIIHNEETKQFQFLEVNTVPQWQGFKKTTKIPVAEEILSFCMNVYVARHKPPAEVIKNYYEKNLTYLPKNKQFHYASRLFFAGKNKKYYAELQVLAAHRGFTDKKSFENKILQIVHRKENLNSVSPVGKKRFEYVRKYPMIKKYVSMLFLTLFAKTVFNRDYRKVVEKHVAHSDFLSLRAALLQDPAAIATLSTIAVNFLYLLEHVYLRSAKSGRSHAQKNIITPAKFFLTIAKKQYTTDLVDYKLQLYLLTHCIIGKTLFYTKKITRADKEYRVFHTMLQLCESTINKRYFEINLDNKIEFLVCAKLCNYQSALEPIILGECENSLSTHGGFLVDTLNIYREDALKNNFSFSEHRNVLYLMLFEMK